MNISLENKVQKRMLLFPWRECLLAIFCFFEFCFVSQAEDPYSSGSEVVGGVTWGYKVFEENGGFTATITLGAKYPVLENAILTIPGTLGGYPVTGIGGHGYGVEWRCGREWRGVKIPNSVTNIGPGAFANQLDCWVFPGPFDVIRMSVTIPAGVTYIGNRAFHSCSALESVSLPANLTYLGEAAFSNCYHLTGIAIPGSVTNIQKSTFLGCLSLERVTIGNGVTDIGDCAFQNCTNLQSVTIPNSVINFGKQAFENCYNLKTITIPGSVANIQKATFKNCRSLESVTIGNGVTNIGDAAFYGCTNLTDVTIPNSVISIGEAFRGCNELTSVTIGEGVSSIDWNVFRDSYNLKTLYVPEWWAGSKLVPWVPSGCIVVYGTAMQTVVFDANGGVCETITNLYSTSGTYSNLPIATWTGYTFDGWYTAPTGGAKITEDTPVATHVPQTFYAHWKGNGYAVTLDWQGGSGGASTVTATYASMMPDIAVPTRTGYTFGGYYNAANGQGTQYYTAEGKSAREWDQTGPATLYAQWIANTYVVTLDWQDGTNGTASATATYGSPMPDIVVPTRTGYTFDGYYSDRNGAGTRYYNAAGESVHSWDMAAAATLYAKWTLEERVLVENVEAKYSWPWGVGISYEVSGTMPTNSPLVVTMTDHAKNATYTALPSALSGDTGAEAGKHRVVWDLDQQGVKLQSSNVTFTVAYEWPLYCVVNLAETNEITGMWYPISESGEVHLSEGQPIYATSPAASFSVAYLNEPPDSGFNTDAYKTTKLVLRRIDPGTFLMGGKYRTTLTQPFYMGVFETTQRQYLLVEGNNPSQYTGAKRPVENVSWNSIRGNTNWPASATVATDSFMGRLRERTSLAFDLPTEAQWEYACRAGTTSEYNNGGNTTNDLNKLGRYNGNTNDGHTAVGSYLPNTWGLYDMHGNVSEWCLDWHGNLTGGVSDPKGPSSGTGREVRGGSWRSSASYSYCTSSSRASGNPTESSATLGFRLARNLLSVSGTSAIVAVQSLGSFDVNKQIKIGIWPFPASDEETVVMLDGSVLFSAEGEASFEWQPQTLGTHVLECRVNGVAMTNKTVNVASLAFATAVEPNPPTAQDLNISISPQTRKVGVGGGVYAIVSSGSGTWTASTSDSWITLNATSGQAGYPVAYSVSATTNVEARTGYVYVSGHVHTVTQEGVGATISPESATFETAGGKGTISVTPPEQGSWQARANVDWVIVTPTCGTGAGAVSYTVAPLNEATTRQGTLTVAGQMFTVFQYGRRIKIAPKKAEYDYKTHVVSITVDALAITAWSVTPSANWISVVDEGSGKGCGTVTISIGENPSWKERIGTVKIGTETFTVTQKGRTVLVFDISPMETTGAAEGANGTIAVTATPDLPWSAKSNQAWLTLDAGTVSGAGNGTVAYSIAPNPNLDIRSGRIVVTAGDPNAGAKTNTVIQSAAVAAISTNGYVFAADGGICEVGVSVSDIVKWQIQNTNAWLTVVGSTNRVGPGTVALQAATNETTYPKEGTVTIAKKTFNVSQKAQGVEVEYGTKQFGADGGSDELSIHAAGQVSWTAVVSDPMWITIWGTNSGTGNGSIMYIVSPYTGEGIGRTGSITIGDKVVRIVQLSQEMDQGFPDLHDAEDVALVLAGATDGRLQERIQSVEAYEAFREWISAKGLDPQAVKESPHAWVLYALGAGRMSENEPTIQIDGLAVGRDGAKGSGSGVAMEVSVTVKDGERELPVDAWKVAGMFDATRALDDWGGQAKLFATATQTGSDGSTMQFKVVPGDGTADGAYLRLALSEEKALQTISFATIEAQTAMESVKLSASATSGGAITFEVVSGPGFVNGDMLSFTGAGTVVVQALQSGNAQWHPASVSQTVTVGKAEQTLSFEPIGERRWQDRVELSATASSGGGVQFEVLSGPGKIEGNLLSFTEPGVVEVQAVQIGDDLWLPASVSQTVTARKAEQTISFASIGVQTTADRVELSAMASNGGTVTFELVSGPGVVEGNMLSFTGPGTVVVRAVQAGDDLWLPISATQTVGVVAEAREFLYVVVDLSAGANASSYPVIYMDESPSGGFNTDEYKTTKLVLRRICPGTFMMGGSVQATLLQPYYIGLFEVTQKQYQLVTGSNPSWFSGDKLPVEGVSWNTIRGNDVWPESSTVSADSFMGRLRARTGLEFDLPTEAQWEYACRAGTTTDFSYGESANGDYMWYSANSSGQTHEVGTKLPNPWGLYNMHGNVGEWCLDWWGALSGGSEPKGPFSGSYRVQRGGGWNGGAGGGTCSYRCYESPSHVSDLDGFRLVQDIHQGQAAQTISFVSVGTQTWKDRVELSASATGGGEVTFELLSGPGVLEGNVLSFTGPGTVVVLAAQAGDAMWLPATARQTIEVMAVDMYMVVDLSAGSGDDAVYPVSYLDREPAGGWPDEYKTTKLVLRRIWPGTFMMGGSVQATLTKPYYMGVFEVTQKQWELVTGSNPSSFSGDKLPVEGVSWNTIRGNGGWPGSSAVSADSFMGRLRARTGLDFDLPTEAQWEYVCRAGTTTAFSYGERANGDYMWYSSNSSRQTHDVGTKLPNPWGLYDMHGNVWEWCLDWYGALSGGTEPEGSSSGAARVTRGGCYGHDAGECASPVRYYCPPSDAYVSIGFRLVKTLSE